MPKELAGLFTLGLFLLALNGAAPIGAWLTNLGVPETYAFIVAFLSILFGPPLLLVAVRGR